MALTDEQELEMYSNVKVIASNCVTCTKKQEDHEKRIRFLEQRYWIFFGVITAIMYALAKIGI